MSNDDLLEDLSADIDDLFPMEDPEQSKGPGSQVNPTADDDGEYEPVPGQLAVDVYETAEQLIIKARTAGVNRNELDVSIADGVLTISGTLSSGDDAGATKWHMQECYWGEFSRTLVLPVAVKEDEVKAILKDGVLTVMFNKVKQEQPRKIVIQ